jgi:hypothetical protein
VEKKLTKNVFLFVGDFFIISQVYSGTGTASVYRAESGRLYLNDVAPITTGLAAGYPNDTGISAHASVYYAEQFEASEWSSIATGTKKAGKFSIG